MPNNDTDDADDNAFDKKTVRKFGPRGSPYFEQEHAETDLNDLTKRVERTEVAVCTCGAPITGADQVHRCCTCELISCHRCTLRLHRQHYCPTCARREYGLDKHVFVSLLFIRNDLLEPDDLTRIETVGDTPVEITVDHAAGVLIEHDYIDDSGELTPTGQEALHVGKQLYGEDSDVQSLVQQIRIQEVVNHGGP